MGEVVNLNRSWFRAAATTDDEAEIVIYDEIGLFGIHAKDFHEELKDLGNVSHINLRVNSPGGDVFDGLAIHNMLKRHKASVTVFIDGIAASIASVIAMAGDAVVMPENAMMMVHDPAGVVVGTSKDMRQIAGALDKVKTALVAAYASKTGMSREEIADLMEEETWMTAEEAVELGFADAIEEPVKMAASFDLSKFRNAPASAGRKRGTASPNPADRKETFMSDSIETPAVEPEAVAGAVEMPAETAATEPAIVEPEAEAVTAKAATAEDFQELLAQFKADITKELLTAVQTARVEASGPEINARHNAQQSKTAAESIDTMGIYAQWNKR